MLDFLTYKDLGRNTIYRERVWMGNVRRRIRKGPLGRNPLGQKTLDLSPLVIVVSLFSCPVQSNTLHSDNVMLPPAINGACLSLLSPSFKHTHTRARAHTHTQTHTQTHQSMVCSWEMFNDIFRTTVNYSTSLVSLSSPVWSWEIFNDITRITQGIRFVVVVVVIVVFL